MQREQPELLIKAAFENPREKLHGDTILIPNEPLDLSTMAETACETDEDEDVIYDEGVYGVFEKIGWPYHTLISFYWQSCGPMVWESSFGVLRLGKGSGIVCLSGDASGDQAIALVRGLSDRSVMSALFKALIEENGSAFGVELFGSLPSNTHNMSEKTIPEKIVRSAFWDWMNWAVKALDCDWLGLAEEVSARARSPILYPLEMLKKFSARASEDTDLVEWLDRRRDRNGNLTERARRAIFDAYFKQSYGPY